MSVRFFAVPLAVVGLAALGLALQVSAQDAGQDDPPDLGHRTDQGLSREQMWRAPTAEDWARPCLITWQRTWEDAVAVSKETGKAVLVCANMDGEIASEHYAGIRYRSPAIAALYEPYVTVIASTYRHNPRDYDEQGRRIPCPRFGGVTCGEHIRIEPVVYEKFFDGRRIAPRHVMVELDGSETYDVFYAFDTASVFDTIRDGISTRANPAPPPARGDRPILERVASRDVRDRDAVEDAYRDGDEALRDALMAAAKESVDAAPIDLLRLAVFGFDVELSKAARSALADSKSVNATGLISDALGVPMEERERDDLIDALETIGEQSPRAKTLSVVHRGLSGDSATVDARDWAVALEGAEYQPAMAAAELDSRLAGQNTVLRAKDADGHAALAEAFLARAFDSQSGAVDGVEQTETELLFRDARRTARQAESLGADDWRVHAVIALSTYYLRGDPEEAHRRSEAAVKALPVGETSFQAMAVLELFAKLRCQEIAKKMRDKEDWPKEWLSDVNSACAVLARHPLGTDAQIAWHYDILKWLGGEGQAKRVLDRGLRRHPQSWALHERLRGRILRDQGIEGLGTVYDRMLASEEPSASLRWFAGYAAQVAAEFQRRRGRDEDAVGSYDEAIERFEAAIAAAPEMRDSADHQVALCLAGKARIAYEAQDDDAALAAVLASFGRREASAATLDGLNISAVDTAKMLRTRLAAGGKTRLQRELQVALDALDPRLLELPAYEFETGRPGNRGQDRSGRREGRGGGGGAGGRGARGGQEGDGGVR